MGASACAPMLSGARRPHRHNRCSGACAPPRQRGGGTQQHVDAPVSTPRPFKPTMSTFIWTSLPMLRTPQPQTQRAHVRDGTRPRRRRTRRQRRNVSRTADWSPVCVATRPSARTPQRHDGRHDTALTRTHASWPNTPSWRLYRFSSTVAAMTGENGLSC
jgi:hypothetical protein